LGKGDLKMAYNTSFYPPNSQNVQGTYYQPPYQMPGYYSQPMQDQLSQLRQNQYQQPQQSGNGNAIIWVQGEAAARAYMVAAGNTVLLMDSDSSTFYMKSTDASGMPQPLRIFDYKERIADQKAAPIASQAPTSVEYVTREEFNALAAKFEEIEAKESDSGKKSKSKEVANA